MTRWASDRSCVRFADFDGLNRPRTIRNCVGGCYTDMVHYTFVGGRVATKEYPQPDPTKTVRQTFWSAAENNYDAFGRLTRSHAVRDPDGAANPLVDIQYQYDDDSNPTWRYDALQNSGATQWSQKYQYDQLNRLSCAMQGAINNWQGQGGQQSISPQKNWVWNDTFGGQTYSLDAMGNFNSFYNNGVVDQRTHNTSNEVITRLLGGTAKNPSYDAAGNMTDDGDQYKFVYDFRNRLISVTTRDATPKKVLDFAYDGLDRRIRKISYATDGVTVVCDVRFLYDGQRIIEKRDHGNSDFLLARYVYGTQYIDEPIRMYRDSNLDGSFADPNDNFYFLQDRLFNVVALADPDGVVQEQVVYEPYGKSTCHRVSDGDETVASHFGNPYLFTGRELDSETGLYNYRGRYYSTALGRFINRDPIGDDINLYRYCYDNPTNATDPSGNEAIAWLCEHNKECAPPSPSTGVVIDGETYPCSCFKKDMKCGPEIGPQLIDTILALNSYFSKNVGFVKSFEATFWAQFGQGISHWDITGLTQVDDVWSTPCYASRKGTICQLCVTVFGVKQDLWEVNYMLWGYLSRKFGGTGTYSYPWVYKNIFKDEIDPCKPKHQYTSYLTDWIAVGYKFADPEAFMTYLFKDSVPKKDNPRFAKCGKCNEALPEGPFKFRLGGSLEK